jgi:hypothetical protein
LPLHLVLVELKTNGRRPGRVQGSVPKKSGSQLNRTGEPEVADGRDRVRNPQVGDELLAGRRFGQFSSNGSYVRIKGFVGLTRLG